MRSVRLLEETFPVSDSRPYVEASFRTYDDREKYYEKMNENEDDRKTRERKLLISLTSVVLSFGVINNLFFWIFDHTSLTMSKAITSFFGHGNEKNIDGIHIPNPNSTAIKNSPLSAYGKMYDSGVRLFSALSYEWTNRLIRLVRDGILLKDKLPKYSMVWYDACKTVSESIKGSVWCNRW